MLSFLGVAILICECAIECCSNFKMWIMFLYFLANMLCSSQKCFASQGPKWSLTILNPFLSRSTAHQAFPFSKIMHYVVSAYKAGPAVLELNTRKKLACQPTQCKEKTVKWQPFKSSFSIATSSVPSAKWKLFGKRCFFC